MASCEYFKDWLHEHRKSPGIIRFKKEDGSVTKTDSKNIEAFSNHFHEVFNKKFEIDWNVIGEFPQRISQISMNDPLTYEEFNISIGTLILHKVSGIDGISQNAIKALGVRNRKYLFDICSEYFNGDMDICNAWKCVCYKKSDC